MSAEDYVRFVSERLRYDVGEFYGAPNRLSLGRGLVYRGIRYPIFIEQDVKFQTVEGIIYILTHECDISTDNKRPFNDDVLVCPLLPFEGFVAEFLKAYGEEKLRAYLKNIATGRMSRLMYFPPIKAHCEYGALVFLNQICSTKVRVFELEGAERVAALSPIGAYEVERVVHQHFLRPKDERLTSMVSH